MLQRRIGASQLALLTTDQHNLLGPMTVDSVPVPLHVNEQPDFSTALDPPWATHPGYAMGEGVGNLPSATLRRGCPFGEILSR